MTASSTRALVVMNVLGANNEPMSVAALCERTEINRMSMGRLLASLSADGLVEGDETGRYSLTLGILEPGYLALARRRVRDLAFPLLVDLSAEVGNEVSLGLYEFPKIVFVETIFVIGSRVSSRLAYTARPLLESHTGRLLASLGSLGSQEALLRRLSEEPGSVEAGRALKDEMSRSRSDGYLVFNRNPDTGSPAGISVPIFDQTEAASAGIVITRPTGLDEVFLHDALPKALDTARRISSAMGSRRRTSLGHI